MSPVPVSQAFAMALEHHQAGRLAEAEALYRQVLTIQSNHAGALQFLGVIANQVGRHDLALNLIRRALVFEPNNSDAHSNLGDAYRSTGHLDEAVASFRRALQLRPDSPVARYNLGTTLIEQHQPDEAIAAFQQAIRLRPDFPEAHNNLGKLLADRRQTDEAVAAFRRALQFNPDYPEACFNLGNALHKQGRYEDAASAYHRALALKPDWPEVLNNLGLALKEQGLLDEATSAFRRALELKPNHRVRSNLIYTLHYQPNQDGREIVEEHHRWNRQFSDPLKHSMRTSARDRNPLRRLKIGYVSPDFRFHAASFFLTPLLESHDHNTCEVYCYSSVQRPDAVTERLRKSADVWRDVHTLSDAQLAECVQDDKVDILVDLAMHTSGSRLLTFARKPAPVQVSWLAYPGSTGVEAIDYRLTDAHIDSADQPDDVPGGAAVRLQDAWCCYAPIETFPTVGPLPALQKGNVTFGSLNQFSKINDGLLRCWAKLLVAVPAAQLLLVCVEGEAHARTHALFAAQGIARERVELVTPGPWPDYMRLFGRIDLALDCFPCNGMTTTCHALWMGIPVITLAGNRAVSRAGRSLLHAVNRPEWVAWNEREYISKAAELASDLPRLAELRSTLRQRMQASPLTDAPRFARNVETAYRTMWQRWCAEHPSSKS